MLLNHATFNFYLLFFSSLSLHKSSTIAFTDTHSFGSVWHRNMNNIYQVKAKDTLLLNNTITQIPILARRAWFWHVASQMVTAT